MNSIKREPKISGNLFRIVVLTSSGLDKDLLVLAETEEGAKQKVSSYFYQNQGVRVVEALPIYANGIYGIPQL